MIWVAWSLAGGQQEIEAAGMAANTSQRKLQYIVLGSRVDAFASWDLIVRCRGGCVRAVPLAGLPDGVMIARLLIRMHCRTCGSAVERAILGNCAPEWQRRVLRV